MWYDMAKKIIVFIFSCNFLVGCKCADRYGSERNNLFSGRIVGKYIDSSYKNIPRIKILLHKKKKIFSFYVNKDTTGLYKHIKIGDSINKPIGSLEFEIIRSNEVFKYNLLNDCCRIDYSGCNSQ